MVDVVAVMLGLAELRENAVANAWSRDVGKFVLSFSFSCSPTSSSSSPSTTTTSFAGFFFVLRSFRLLSFGLVFVLPGPYQLLSNVHQLIRARIVPCACLSLA